MGYEYEIRVRGRLGPALADAFTPLTATATPVETVLVGPVADQAALHGLLARVQALGLELVEIRRRTESADDRSDRAPTPDRWVEN